MVPIREVILFVALVSIFQTVFFLSSSLNTALWDFEICYFSAKGYFEGHDPYNHSLLNSIYHERAEHFPEGGAFVYPIFTVYFFFPFTFFSLSLAKSLFLILLGVSFVGSSYLTYQILRKNSSGNFSFLEIFLLFIFFMFAMNLSFSSGNIELFLVFIVLGGFFLFLQGKYYLAAMLLSFPALVKFPYAYLGSIFIFGREKKLGAFLVFASIITSYYFIFIFIKPFEFSNFLSSLSAVSLSNQPDFAFFDVITFFLVRFIPKQLAIFVSFVFFVVTSLIFLLMMWIDRRILPSIDVICGAIILFLLFSVRLNIYIIFVFLPFILYTMVNKENQIKQLLNNQEWKTVVILSIVFVSLISLFASVSITIPRIRMILILVFFVPFIFETISSWRTQISEVFLKRKR